MRILLTNDDGVDSIGLHVLARAMRRHGDVVIAAPDAEYSGSGASLGALHLIKPEVHRREVEGIAEAWAVTGPPALCVMFARLGAFGSPFDLVVSGINPGANVGRSVYHSGTVGACLTGRNGGISGVAVSQNVVGFGVEGQGSEDSLLDQRWESAAAVADVVVGGLIADHPAEPVVVNINVPNTSVEDFAGWRSTQVGTRPPRSMVEAVLTPVKGKVDCFHVEMGWGDELELPADTDSGAVARGVVSISYLSRIEATHRADLPRIDSALDQMLVEAGSGRPDQSVGRTDN